MVIPFQFIHADVFANADVAEEAEILFFGGAVVHFRDRFNFLMVGGNAVPYQSERGWQRFKHINLYIDIFLLE